MNCPRVLSVSFATIGLLFAAGAGPAIAQTCVPAPSGMIAWWPGDGTANDIAGSHDGVFEPPGSASFAPGKVDQAFSFDGNRWVEVADDPIWTLGTNDFTIDLWVKFNSLSGRDPFIAHDDGAGAGGGEGNKWIFWYDAEGHDQLLGTPALRFHINRSPKGPIRDAVAVQWNPTPGPWYHLAVTKERNRYTLYIDGAAVATDVIGTPIADPVVPLTIGMAEVIYRLDGLVDEVEIFNRALAAAEVYSIFAAGAAGKCK